MAEILVIDDNADLLQMMRLILQERGDHQVILSADGADGLSRALSAPPDLAIVDVMMPGITGYDVVRRLREQPQTAEMPILILTARGQMVDRQTALQAGADDHMAKPVTPRAMLDKVDELLALRKGASVSGDGGRIVSLLSLKGGVGVTTLAVNLALGALREEQTDAEPASVCLVDLSPASGQAVLHLRVKARGTWAALPGLGTNPSFDDLKPLLTPHASGLQLLASPFEPTHANILSAAMVEGMLSVLGRHFDWVVIDAPPLIDVAAAAALDASDPIILVLTPQVGAIQSTVAVLKVMDELEDKVLVVLNRTDSQPGLPTETVEKALRRQLAQKIPHDPAQMTALAQGKPLAWAQPSTPLVKAVGPLVALVRARQMA